MSKPAPDTIDRTVAFLQKREGIDKALKLIRYTASLISAASPNKDTELISRLSALEKSIGQSRKAFRLGKFLQDFNNIRKSNATGYVSLVELVAYSGEGIYLFIEQISWLMKAGAIGKEYEKPLGLISSYAELAGYLADLYLVVLAVRELSVKEASVAAKLEKAQKEEGADAQPSAAVASLQRDLSAVRFKRALKVGAAVQNVMDALICINDLRGGKDPIISDKVVLSLAGLLSGSISFYKVWSS